MTSDPIPTVLLVEDSEDDVILFKMSWRKAGLSYALQHVEDGRQTLDYLTGQGRFADRGRYPLPFLVVLDLNLPQIQGLDVLQWARGQRELDGVGIVIVSSSPEPSDVERAYAYGANCYLTKAVSVETLKELMEAVSQASPASYPGVVLSVRGAEQPRSLVSDSPSAGVLARRAQPAHE